MRLIFAALLAYGVPALAASPRAVRSAVQAPLPARPVSAIAAAPAVSPAAAAAKAGAPASAQQAMQTVGAVFAELGRPAAAPETTLRGAYDGGIKKGSFEAEFLAPPPVNGRVDLSALDPADRRGYGKKQIEKLTKAERKKLTRQQKKVYAAKQRAVVGLVNGIDTSGKDGRIKGLFKALDPHSASVVSSKQPTSEEVKHHYLWRHVKVLPGPGKIVLFNRSYYEDIVVPLALPEFYKKAWGRLPSKREILQRLDELNAFEKRLVDEGYVVVKFFLHLSRGEQKSRLEQRRDDPKKNYKFSEDDLATRKRWGPFHRAWELILARNNTAHAPFFIVPADDKPFADYVVTRLLRKAIKRAHLRFPKAKPGTEKIVIPD